MIEIIKNDLMFVNKSIHYKIENGEKNLSSDNKKWLDKNITPRIAYILAKNKVYDLYNLEKYEDEACKELYYAYLFAKKVSGANIKKCQEAACKDPEWAYMFALYIPGADIEKCQKTACKNPFFAYWFAKNIPEANIQKCQEAARKDFYWAYKFAKNIKIKKVNI